VCSELRQWTPTLKLSKTAKTCDNVWRRILLASHDAFLGGSLLPFFKRRAIKIAAEKKQKAKDERAKKEKKRKQKKKRSESKR